MTWRGWASLPIFLLLDRRVRPSISQPVLFTFFQQKETVMSLKLSQKEKVIRGTSRRNRVPGPRSLTVIEADLREVRRVIADLQYNVAVARKSVRTDGVLIEVTVTDHHGHFAKSKKLNPAFRVINDSLKLLRSFNRQFELLSDERELTLFERQKERNHSEEFSV
jgi:hypothetical protein